MLRSQIDNVVGAELVFCAQEPFQSQPLGYAGILAVTVLCHAFDIGVNEIGQRRLARCCLIDEQAAIHFGLGLARPGLCFLPRAEGAALERPAFTPDLDLPLAFRFFSNGRHYSAPLE